MRRALLFTLFVAGCGLDALIFTPRGYDATPPPQVVLVARLEGAAVVSVVGPDDRVLTSIEAPGGEVEIPLPPGVFGSRLRVLARAGSRTFKALVVDAPAGQFTDIGPIDLRSTALAQLATFEIVGEAGSTFSGTPPAALRGMLRKMAEAPTAELDAFAALVGRALTMAPTDGSLPGLFDALGFEASAPVLESVAIDPATYRELLSAAARGYGLEVRCDPSRLNVMFAVDLSGRARDGNGLPQLIRQPPKEGRAFLGFTADETSPIGGDALPKKLTPNDPSFAMTDDGQGGDERAGDGVYTVVVPLPRGARLLYKYTDGASGEGFTGTEEWPGNARILEVEDVLTGRPDGEPDCVIVRRDAFGDEAANKNFVNLHPRARAVGGTVGFELDLGGPEAPSGPAGLRLGGLDRESLRSGPGLTPAGVPEARENGVCAPCPAPIVLDPDDATPPILLSAERTAVDRVIVRFSEPVSAEDARDVGKFALFDDAQRALTVRSGRASGSDVLLDIEPAHPTQPFRLVVRQIGDVSAMKNVLESAEVPVLPDVTPPKIVSARALSRRVIDPSAQLPDPTVGEVVELVLDETPELSAASDPARFVIEGLDVRAAAIVAVAPAPTIRLVTAVQAKGQTYSIRARGLRDVAGNAEDHAIDFTGFALYRVTFAAVPGFALLTADGEARGVPRGERLYLTGTPLSEARALDGADLSIPTRTDVTGWPQFEMKPRGREHVAASGARAPIYQIDLLLPPGSWSWKLAHGVEGEQLSPPPTLEKVAKALSTTNDGTGVRIDPVTMRAENGVEYAGARLAITGDEPARRSTVFKREAPDEGCEVRARDVECPLVVIGTWRDAMLSMGRSIDFDDGLVTLPLHHPTLPDFSAPRLLDARARDSSTIVLSFDESIVRGRLDVELARASDGHGLRASLLQDAEIPAHQAMIRTSEARLDDAGVYTVRYRGASDSLGHVDREWRTATVLAPASETPPLPLLDRTPPVVLTATVTDIAEVLVRFDERLDPATISRAGFNIVGLEVSAVALEPDRASVRLTTARQTIRQSYVLTVTGVGDVSDPANLLASQVVPFVGFGEGRPPVIARARAIAADRVLVRFDEPIDPASASSVASWAIDGGATIVSATFGDDPTRRALAFNARLAPRLRDSVILVTSALTDGQAYVVSAPGVTDLSGNRAAGSAAVMGVLAPPTVDVILEVHITSTVAIAGQIPSRAFGLARLRDSREGVFALGARALENGTSVVGGAGPVNDALGGFPPEGLPLDGLEPRLLDDGAGPDRAAGDGVFSILLPQVPLGTTVAWKAFAPFTVAYKDRASTDSAAAFADASPGPSAFADGQEYPGNENGAVILDEGAVRGVVRVRAIFGDEITYKKFSSRPAFLWVTGDRRP